MMQPGSGLLSAFMLIAVDGSAALCAQQTQFMRDPAIAASLAAPPGVTRRLYPVAADLDADGRSDVVFATEFGFELFRNLGAGRYSSSFVAANVAATATAFQVADLDADGLPDLIAFEPTGMVVLWNDASSFGNFTTAPLAGNTVWDDETVLGDIDGDGDLDLLRVADTLVVRADNLGNRTFAVGSLFSFALVPTPAKLWLADLDGDSDLDLATTIRLFGLGSRMLQNDGTGNLTAGFSADLGFDAALTGLDADGDGDLDFLSGGLQQPNLLSINLGNGTFVNGSASLPANLGIAGQAHVSDFDRDGDLDALLNNGTFLENNGLGTFLNRGNSRLLQADLRNRTPTLVDLDGDGDDDLALPLERTISIAGALCNHVRQLRSVSAPAVGGRFELDLFTGPGFAPTGVEVLFASLAVPALPGIIPDIEGTLDLDLSVAAFVTLRPMSRVGISRVFLPIANAATLAGAAIVFQHARFATESAGGIWQCSATHGCPVSLRPSVRRARTPRSENLAD